MEIAVDELRLSSRRVLKAGSVFRVKRGSGPYRIGTREPRLRLSGVFRCVRLFRYSNRPARVYAEAVSVESARTHCLYVSGPNHVSTVDERTMVRPFQIALPGRKREWRRHACVR